MRHRHTKPGFRELYWWMSGDQTDDRLLLSGEPEDFGRFYDRHVRAVLAFFQRRTGDPEAAADLTAETFASALVARKRYRAGGAPASAWLFTIAQRRLSDYRRRGSADDRMQRRLRMDRVPVGAEDAEMIRWLGEEVATQLLDELPDDQRDVVRAHVLDDRGYAELAGSYDLSEATVRKRVSRGLRALRARTGGER